MLKALLNAKFDVTVLTRQTSTVVFPSSVKVVQVDYESGESLKGVLKGIDALVSTLTTGSIAKQQKLVDAAIEDGLKRIIPSDFGADLEIDTVRSLPVLKPKVDMQAYIRNKCSGTRTTYTFIANNIFLDWSIDNKFLVDLEGKRIDLYDGGHVPISTAPTDFVARATAAVLLRPVETANKTVRIQGILTTQRRILEIAQRQLGDDGWQVNNVSTQDVEEEAWRSLQQDPENFWSWGMGMLVRASFGEGFSRDFSANNDNELLGLSEIREDELERYIQRCIETGRSSIT